MSKKQKTPMRYKTVRRLRGILIGFEVLFGLIVLLAGIIYFVPSFRNQAIKAMAGTNAGRTVIGWFSKSDYETNIQDKNFQDDKIVVNDIKKADLEKYTEILLIGIDARGDEMDDSTNSDSMIVLHIDNDTGKVKMISVYRDTLLEIIGADGQSLGYRAKVNSAYSREGVQACINTLNTNLDLHIKDYVVLNFTGVTKIIDELGGIDVTLNQDEVYQLNEHLADTKINTGLYAPNIKKPGKNHLVGLQATTYMRIRKAEYKDEETGEIIRDDYGRAARQQAVIKKLIKKVKEAGLQSTLNTVDIILSSNTEKDRILKTSMSFDEIMSLVPTLFDFKLAGGQGFPTARVGIDTEEFGDALVPQGLEYNVLAMHQFLYGKDDYQVSDVVKNIDLSIQHDTGVAPLDASQESQTSTNGQ